MTFGAWLRSRPGQTVGATLLWVVAGANLFWCIGDLRERYDKVVVIQALRAACEARGGFYGAIRGEGERCFVP